MRQLMKPGILRSLLMAFLAFGALLGLLFAVYTRGFMEWRPDMYWPFVASCVAGGLLAGAVNFCCLE